MNQVLMVAALSMAASCGTRVGHSASVASAQDPVATTAGTADRAVLGETTDALGRSGEPSAAHVGAGGAAPAPARGAGAGTTRAGGGGPGGRGGARSG